MAVSLGSRVHHSSNGKRPLCGGSNDARDPRTSSWREVTCPHCLREGFVEIAVGTWRVFAPEQTAESVQLVLQGVAALVSRGRSPVELRPSVRRLLTVELAARLPGDPALQGLAIRRYCASPLEATRLKKG